MDNIKKILKSKLNCESVNSEIVEFDNEKDFLPKRGKIKFDFVIKNNNKIEALGLKVQETDLDSYVKGIIEKIPVNFYYPVFYIASVNNCGLLTPNLYYSEKIANLSKRPEYDIFENRDVIYYDHIDKLIFDIKDLCKDLMNEEDFEFRELAREVKNLQWKLKDSEKKYINENNTLQSENIYQKEQLEKLEIKINKYIKTDKTKTVFAISNCLFMTELKGAIPKLKLPESNEIKSDIKTGYGYNEKYSVTNFINNNHFEFYLGSISNKFYLVLESYTWVAEYSSNVPSTNYYYYYDDINNDFTPVDGKEVEDILTWIPLKDF